ncbi:MAG TPA: hypothetical protein VFD59_07080 [Nocardioidaceae bacterium]|nr:hypothetical protein [Nocardioidaceae bacterium]
MMWNIGGHVGTSVSALVDGQLAPEAAERAWSHVLGCRPCRRLVEQEGRVKAELSTLVGSDPSAQLLGSLYSLDDTGKAHFPSWHGLEAWAAVDEIERRGSGRRRAGLAIVGAGSVSAAVIGFASLSGAPLGIGGAPAGAPSTSVSRPDSASAPTTAVIAPSVVVHGRLPTGQHSPGAQRSVVLQERQ